MMNTLEELATGDGSIEAPAHAAPLGDRDVTWPTSNGGSVTVKPVGMHSHSVPPWSHPSRSGRTATTTRRTADATDAAPSGAQEPRDVPLLPVERPSEVGKLTLALAELRWVHATS